MENFYDDVTYDKRVLEVSKKLLGPDGHLSEEAVMEIITNAAGDRVMLECLIRANTRLVKINAALEQQLSFSKNLCNICRSVDSD